VKDFTPWHSGPEIGKNWNKLIIFFAPKQIFSSPIQDRAKMAVKKVDLAINFENFEEKKVEFLLKNREFYLFGFAKYKKLFFWIQGD
jgi:hypothetical protein